MTIHDRATLGGGMGTRIQVEVRDLLPGDKLVGSDRTVKHVHRVPHREKGTSGLKHFVLLEGEDSPRCWGRYTKMWVIRDAAS